MIRNKPLLSFCMIVKNEEAYLPHCLQSVKDVADELIVVDTGSSDSTKEIAQSYGAQVYDFQWCDDFAAARNFGLDRSNGQYILFLDADEELDFAAASQLRAFLQDTAADGIYLIVRSYSTPDALAPYYDSQQVRLFRNCRTYRFQNAIHEMIYPAIAAQGGRFAKSSFIIHHYGYLKQVVQATESRIERDRRILENMVLRHPDSLYAKAKLGFIYLIEKKYPQAFNLLTEVVQQVDANTVEADFLQSLFVALAETSLYLRNYDVAKKSAQAGWALNAEPLLTRSAKFYQALASSASTLERLEELAASAEMSISKSHLYAELKHMEHEIKSSAVLLNELCTEPDLLPQALKTLYHWRQKVNAAHKLVQNLLGVYHEEIE
jgi:glycosyltransferase involved in cell wall biosynthesis